MSQAGDNTLILDTTKGKVARRPAYISLSFGAFHTTPEWNGVTKIDFAAGGRRYSYKPMRADQTGAGYECAQIWIELAEFQKMVSSGSLEFQVGPTKDTIEGDWLAPMRVLLERLPRN